MTPASMRRALRGSAFAAAALAGAVLALVAVAWMVNLREEPLTPLTQALQQPPPADCAPGDNLYLALQELAVPTRAALPARADRGRGASVPPPAASVRRLAFRGDVGFLHPLDGAVLREATVHREAIGQLLSDNAELYQRYLALLPLRTFCATAPPGAFDPVPLVEGVRRLFLAAIALHVSAGYAHERALAFADLAADAQMWHAVLRAPADLVWKMLAVASLHGDALLLADLVGDAHTPLPAGAAPQVLAPVAPLADFDVGSGYAAAFRALAAALREADAPPGEAAAPAGGQPRPSVRARARGAVARHFFKVDATENLLARESARRIAAAADPTQYAAVRRSGFLLEGASVWGLPLAYNPLGKVLAAEALPGDDDYAARAWDGAALERLVRAALEIRVRGLAAAEVPAFLAAHPEWSRHPADGRPFVFDARAATLALRPVAHAAVRERFAVPLALSAAGDAPAAALAPPAAPR